MKIDKSLGKWINDATYLDDVAYFLFVKNLKIARNHKNEYVLHVVTTQLVFIDNKNHSYIAPYYKKAIQLIRTEKLNKINED